MTDRSIDTRTEKPPATPRPPSIVGKGNPEGSDEATRRFAPGDPPKTAELLTFKPLKGKPDENRPRAPREDPPVMLTFPAKRQSGSSPRIWYGVLVGILVVLGALGLLVGRTSSISIIITRAQSPDVQASLVPSADSAPSEAVLTPAPPTPSPTQPHGSLRKAVTQGSVGLSVPSDRVEVAVLMDDAKKWLARGDIATARLVLRRAAEAGDTQAALTLAETYDPATLEKWKVRGIAADPALAKRWYEEARNLGSREAQDRLNRLSK